MDILYIAIVHINPFICNVSHLSCLAHDIFVLYTQSVIIKSMDMHDDLNGKIIDLQKANTKIQVSIENDIISNRYYWYAV